MQSNNETRLALYFIFIVTIGLLVVESTVMWSLAVTSDAPWPVHAMWGFLMGLVAMPLTLVGAGLMVHEVWWKNRGLYERIEAERLTRSEDQARLRQLALQAFEHNLLNSLESGNPLDAETKEVFRKALGEGR